MDKQRISRDIVSVTPDDPRFLTQQERMLRQRQLAAEQRKRDEQHKPRVHMVQGGLCTPK